MIPYLSLLLSFLIPHTKSRIKLIYNWTYDSNEDFDFRWSIFTQTHNKTYSGRELAIRREIFRHNTKLIDEHNEEYLHGKKSFSLGVNNLADMTRWEILGLHGGLNYRKKQHIIFGSRPPRDIPRTVNWKNLKAVTPVKNQGRCGSCYAFSSTGSIEGQNAIKKGKLESFSEQQIIDCSELFGNNGCRGGMPDNSYKYIRETGGLDLERDYPYEAEVGSCRYNGHPLNVTGFVDITTGNEEELKLAVATVGPISAGIDASHFSFHFYKSGIYNEPRCSSEDLDHAILVVGYGEEKGVEYWEVKNSWGVSWGQSGFIQMSRGKGNQCGIATMGSYPLVH